MLTVDTAPDYLLKAGLISTQTILDGDLDIVSITRRNANLKVTTRDRGFLLKQPLAGDGLLDASLHIEARFYAYCHQTPALAGVARALPGLAFHDPDKGIFAIDLLTDTIPLWRYYRERTADRFPLDVVSDVGRLLGLIHRCFSDLPEEHRPDFLSGELPWALSIDRPTPGKLSRISAAHYDLIRLLQEESGVVDRMNELRRMWHTSGIVHGDIKMDNFLVRQPEGHGERGVFLIDWELVQRGDPAWDVAGALQDFVFWWVLNMPHDKPPEAMIEAARFPLPVLQAGIRALWDGYRTAYGLDEVRGAELLQRAVPYSAARILQTAAEIASKYQILPAPAVLMAQIGVNLLQDPEAGLHQLYALEEPIPS